MNQRKAFEVPEGLNFGALWSEGGQGRMGVPPWRDPQRYIDNSPLFWAHQIETPLLLIHGDLDFVNVNEAEQLFAALHRQGKDVQLRSEEHTSELQSLMRISYAVFCLKKKNKITTKTTKTHTQYRPLISTQYTKYSIYKSLSLNYSQKYDPTHRSTENRHHHSLVSVTNTATLIILILRTHKTLL